MEQTTDTETLCKSCVETGSSECITHTHVSTPTKRLASLFKIYESVQKSHFEAVLSLCSELSPLEAFEARLALIENIPEFRQIVDEDEDEDNIFVYEGVSCGSFDVDIPGHEDPRYIWEFSGHYEDHDVFVGRFTIEVYNKDVYE